MSLERQARLARKKPLKAASGLKRGTGLSRAPRPQAAGQRRDTGPSRTVRAAVMRHDGWCCADCGRCVTGIPYSVQHVIARGMDGTPGPEANSPVRLVLLCGSATSPGGCHLLCEQRDPVMHERGLWLHSWEAPGVVVYATPGGLVPYRLHPDGTRTLVTAGEVAS